MYTDLVSLYYQGVWSELAKVWDQIDEMKEKTWLSVAPRKLRTQIDALLGQLRDMPSRLRHYPSYEFVKKLLQSYAKVSGAAASSVASCDSNSWSHVTVHMSLLT